MDLHNPLAVEVEILVVFPVSAIRVVSDEGLLQRTSVSRLVDRKLALIRVDCRGVVSDVVGHAGEEAFVSRMEDEGARLLQGPSSGVAREDQAIVPGRYRSIAAQHGFTVDDVEVDRLAVVDTDVDVVDRCCERHHAVVSVILGVRLARAIALLGVVEGENRCARGRIDIPAPGGAWLEGFDTAAR
ncbi:hypothetical protein ACI1US_01908 [Leucobacter sp. BZR 635]